jgi:hypothetical protein
MTQAAPEVAELERLFCRSQGNGSQTIGSVIVSFSARSSASSAARVGHGSRIAQLITARINTLQAINRVVIAPLQFGPTGRNGEIGGGVAGAGILKTAKALGVGTSVVQRIKATLA